DYRGSGRQRRADVESRQTRGSQNRAGQVRTYQGQTMQEKQRKRQAALQARRKRRLRRQKQLLAVLLCVLLGGTVFAVFHLRNETFAAQTGGQGVGHVQAESVSDIFSWREIQGIAEKQFNQHPEWTEDFLTISEYSRPGEPLNEVNNIFVHYTANIRTSAAQNRSYFENLKDNHDVPGASAHFIIGIEGEILQIVPLDEIAYAVQTRNEDSISIECCYKYENGQFTQETYNSLIKLLAWLVDTYELETDDILRHYDCGGKKCPLYYVDNEDAWRILKLDVGKQISLLSKQ
ncbi:MAG: N-acetylmuramoyl-L-alanine amidase, partial [Acetatifactor sp.]|nr:N-acetylmuramoyl-L-alanine amidase [Acetatifactor sp.]